MKQGFQQQHLCWQQTIDIENNKRMRYRSKNEDKFYDFNKQEANLNKIQKIRMKNEFLGKHLAKYTGPTQPSVDKGSGKFGPLQMTGYITMNGFNTIASPKGGRR